MAFVAGVLFVAIGSGCGGAGKSGPIETTTRPAASTAGATNPRPPSFAETFNLAPARGKILVQLPASSGFAPLAGPRRVPVGTLVDARLGVVRLIAATATAGRLAVGDFQAGIFEILQAHAEGGLIELRIRNDQAVRSTCDRTRARVASHHLSKRPFGRLLGVASGPFRTQGEFAAATVRGTSWGVRDRCDGTLTIVRRGVVVVSDFGLHRQIIVRAGHTYLARAP